MMKDLSLHILDIAENSVRARSPIIFIDIDENMAANLLSITISDQGCGMSEETVQKATDPFHTSRTTRKVGMGLALLSQTCAMCGGRLTINSKPGEGTTVRATMAYDNIDRPPLGDIAETIRVLIIMRPEHDFVYTHRVNGNVYELDTREVKDVLEGVPLSEPSVMEWLKENLQDGLAGIRDIYSER